jgi:hypothetical protein
MQSDPALMPPRVKQQTVQRPAILAGCWTSYEANRKADLIRVVSINGVI